MAIEILYFARIREAIGKGGEIVELPGSIVTVTDLIDWLAARGGGYGEAFADRDRVRVAIDQRFASADGRLAGAHEIALFPPVTGG